MFNFLKKLYEQRYKKITVILLDDSKPSEDNSYYFKPSRFFSLMIIVFVMMSILLSLGFMFTPIGSVLYRKEDDEIRKQVESITFRVNALQDSLYVRDNQLNDMKNIIRLSIDTSLVMDERFNTMFNDAQTNNSDEYLNRIDMPNDDIRTTKMFFSNIYKAASDFPSSFPVSGTLTRVFESDKSHYGIDIATKENELIATIADGTVINTNWTISDGYVISVQHAGGLISIYKHCSSVLKKNGDVILKGDIIGTTGNVGISSTGAHLHLEIWKNGMPQNPEIYLIQ